MRTNNKLTTSQLITLHDFLKSHYTLDQLRELNNEVIAQQTTIVLDFPVSKGNIQGMLLEVFKMGKRAKPKEITLEYCHKLIIHLYEQLGQEIPK